MTVSPRLGWRKHKFMPVLPRFGWRKHKFMPVLPRLGWRKHKFMPVLPRFGWRKHKFMPVLPRLVDGSISLCQYFPVWVGESISLCQHPLYSFCQRSPFRWYRVPWLWLCDVAKVQKVFRKRKKMPRFFFSLGLYCGLDGFVEYDKTVGREVFFVARGL